MFARASNIAIVGGTFINQTHSRTSGAFRRVSLLKADAHAQHWFTAFDKLSAAAAHSALHDAPARTDETRCHPHTRTNALDNLERWGRGLYQKNEVDDDYGYDTEDWDEHFAEDAGTNKNADKDGKEDEKDRKSVV